MKFKRLAGLFLAIALVIGLLPTASASTGAKVSLSSGTVKAGSSVTLTVSIKDNPGLAAWMLYIYYDTDVFSVDPDKDLKASGKFASSGTLLGNSIEAAKETGRYDGNARKDGVLALWFNATNVTGDGTMMTITLHTEKSAPNGTYSIGLGYSTDGACNEDAEYVMLTTAGGTVTVTGGTTGGNTSEDDEVPEFSDVDGHWAYDFIADAAELGLMEGVGDGKFNPEGKLTRAEFVTVLWRAAGEPKAAKASTFTDIDPKQTWYHEALAWAQENDIIKGTGGTEFEPMGIVSREQVALILYRLAGSPTGMEVMFASLYDGQYSDSGSIHDWAKKAVYWSIYNGIYCGENTVEIGNKLVPLADATRAQIAVMMVRYLEDQGGI